MSARDVAWSALKTKFKPNDSTQDPADCSCMVTFRAPDGYLSIGSLSFGEVVDCLVEAGLIEVSS